MSDSPSDSQRADDKVKTLASKSKSGARNVANAARRSIRRHLVVYVLTVV